MYWILRFSGSWIGAHTRQDTPCQRTLLQDSTYRANSHTREGRPEAPVPWNTCTGEPEKWNKVSKENLKFATMYESLIVYHRLTSMPRAHCTLSQDNKIQQGPNQLDEVSSAVSILSQNRRIEETSIQRLPAYDRSWHCAASHHGA